MGKPASKTEFSIRKRIGACIGAILVVAVFASAIPIYSSADSLDADLSLSIWDTPDPVTAGTTLDHQIVVLNGGPEPASSVTMTVQLPTDVVYRSYTASQGTCQAIGQTFTCNIGTLLVNGSAWVRITVDVAPEARGTLTYTATVSAVENDPDPSNNEADAQTAVQTDVDLVLAQDGTPTPAVTGGVVDYTLVVSNVGQSTATQVVLNDTLPAGATLQRIARGQGSCGHTGPEAVSCNLGDLAPGQTVTTTLRIRAAADSKTLYNYVTVVAAEPDAYAADNASLHTTPVITGTDIAVQLWAVPASVAIAGSTLGYKVQVDNTGPFTANHVNLQVALPPSVTLEAMTSTSGICTTTGEGIICSIDKMVAGISDTSLHYTVTIASDFVGDLSTTASISADEPEGNPEDNTVTLTTPVEARADLALTAMAPSMVPVGGQLACRHIIANTGPSDAVSLTLTVTHPSGVVFEAGTGAECALADSLTGDARCTMSRLKPGHTLTVTVYGNLTETLRGTLVVTAAVASLVEDPKPDNNVAFVTTRVSYFSYLPMILKNH